MARKLSDEEEQMAPPGFIPQANRQWSTTYHCELITPMVGGGVESWKRDDQNLVRSQSVKGHLRFWWRTMQSYATAAEMKAAEDELWGSTKIASPVRLNIAEISNLELLPLKRNEKNIRDFEKAGVPGYVLFPFQSPDSPEPAELVKKLSFKVEISCPEKFKVAVENSAILWHLFGGLGARTSRGCGSIFCDEMMQQFKTTEDVIAFLDKVKPEQYQSCQSPFPSLANCRFGAYTVSNHVDPIHEWCSYLKSYGDFRQKPGVGRNIGQGNRPERSRWPEPDAIRRITKQHSGNHQPEHPAGNWFPRGAFGLPIQTEFKNAQGDPTGTFTLKPANADRWPSPVILKVVKLGTGQIARICLILNHKIPEKIVIDRQRTAIHLLAANELPLSFKGKTMPPNATMLKSGENPFDALLRHLKLQEVK